MSTELLPCPFCGGQAIGAQPYADGARVYCKGCGITTGTHRDMPSVAVKWNRRTVRPSHKSANVFRNLERVVESIELDPRHAASAILELRFLEKLLVALATLADTSPAPADNSPAALVAEFVDAARAGFP